MSTNKIRSDLGKLLTKFVREHGSNDCLTIDNDSEIYICGRNVYIEIEAEDPEFGTKVTYSILLEMDNV